MINHIDVILYRTIIKSQFPWLTDEPLLSQLKITQEQLEIVGTMVPPSTHQLCHAMKKKGYAPVFIAKSLGIKQPTVSYHLSRPVKQEYIDPYLHSIQTSQTS